MNAYKKAAMSPVLPARSHPQNGSSRHFVDYSSQVPDFFASARSAQAFISSFFLCRSGEILSSGNSISICEISFTFLSPNPHGTALFRTVPRNEKFLPVYFSPRGFVFLRVHSWLFLLRPASRTLLPQVAMSPRHCVAPLQF